MNEQQVARHGANVRLRTLLCVVVLAVSGCTGGADVDVDSDDTVETETTDSPATGEEAPDESDGVSTSVTLDGNGDSGGTADTVAEAEGTATSSTTSTGSAPSDAGDSPATTVPDPGVSTQGGG